MWTFVAGCNAVKQSVMCFLYLLIEGLLKAVDWMTVGLLQCEGEEKLFFYESTNKPKRHLCDRKPKWLCYHIQLTEKKYVSLIKNINIERNRKANQQTAHTKKKILSQSAAHVAN